MIMLLAPATGQAQNLSAFVDRDEISENDVLKLTIRVGSQLGNNRPVLTGLNRDFILLGTSTMNSYTQINGNTQAWTEYIISLRAKTSGRFTIPAFRVGSQTTTPITITVAVASLDSNSTFDDIFLVSSVSKEEVYVQEQLLYTVKIYYNIGFNQGAQLTNPQVNNSVVQQLGTDERYQEILNSISYNVTERNYVIYPQASGQLTIPPVYFTATVGGRGLRSLRSPGARQINLASDSWIINVLSKPASFPATTWLPAASLNLEESWSGDTDSLDVGGSITRNIVIRATGLSSSLLPDIEYKDIVGLKFYPDQPVREDSSDHNGITGTRSKGTAIVPSESGEFILPEIEIPWWNTVTNTLEKAIIPSRTLNVLTGVSNSQAQFQPSSGNFGPGDINFPTGIESPVTPASQTSGLYLFWIIATVLFAAAWLFTTAMWLRSRKMLDFASNQSYVSDQTPIIPVTQQSGARNLPDLNRAYKLLQQACKQDNLSDIKKSLVSWGQSYFQNLNILSLDHLQSYCKNPTLTASFATLKQTLYSDHPESSDFQSDQLLKEITIIHKSRNKRADRKKTDYTLPPLYKN